MNKKQSENGSAHIVIIIGLVIVVIAALGWIFWQNFIFKQPSSTASQVVVTKPKVAQTPTSNTSSTSSAYMFSIPEFGVSYTMPADITKVLYNYDTSESFFPGNAAQITSITTSNGKTYPLHDPSATDPSSEDALCQVMGIGESDQASVANPTSGGTYTSMGSKDGKYFYKLASDGAGCGQSPGAQQAVSEVMNALKNPT